MPGELNIKLYLESFPLGVGHLPTRCEASDCMKWAKYRVRYRIGDVGSVYYLCEEHQRKALNLQPKCMFSKGEIK